MMVANTGDWQVQVGRRYHFVDTNSGLHFDWELSRGLWLDSAAGTEVRFKRSQTRGLRLVPYGGRRKITGLSHR